ncbi:MAG TPA: DUF192 domain-containing protein [Myxococcaceae bacterium]|nr:DUF192 domain-containing protein [Myxococcaceae bacterium]
MRRWLLLLVLGCVSACPASTSATPAESRQPAAVNRPSPNPPRSPTRDPSARDWVGPELPRAKVILVDAYGAPHGVRVEVAHTADSRERGLMWRESLPAGEGMLFLFPFEVVQSFWMRNTLIPLDILFINEALEVVGIVENAEPLTRTGRSVGIPSRYVLEVPGGWTRAKGIVSGSKVRFEGVAAIPIR